MNNPMSDPLPLDANLIVRNARRAQNSGAAADAYVLYLQLNDADPQNTLAWIGRSEAAEDADEQLISLGYAVALDESNRALADRLRARLDERLKNAQGTDATRLFQVGREFALVGLRRTAGQVFQRVTELDPTHYEAWLWRGGVTADHGEAQTAIGVAQALAPDEPAVQAAVDWLEGTPYIPPLRPAVETSPVLPTSEPVAEPESQAAVVVREAPSAKPDSRAVELEQAFAFADQMLQAGDKRGAHPHFVRATELDPRNERAWLGRARTAEDTDEALASLDNALNLNPENAQVREVRNFLRRQKLREGQPPPERLDAQHPLRAAVQTPESTEQPARSPVLFIVLVVILLVLLAGLALWFLGYFKLF